MKLENILKKNHENLIMFKWAKKHIQLCLALLEVPHRVTYV